MTCLGSLIGILNIQRGGRYPVDDTRPQYDIEGARPAVSPSYFALLTTEQYHAFMVPAKILNCIFKHRYLISPNGNVKQLLSRIIDIRR